MYSPASSVKDWVSRRLALISVMLYSNPGRPSAFPTMSLAGLLPAKAIVHVMLTEDSSGT